MISGSSILLNDETKIDLFGHTDVIEESLANDRRDFPVKEHCKNSQTRKRYWSGICGFENGWVSHRTMIQITRPRLCLPDFKIIRYHCYYSCQ